MRETLLVILTIFSHATLAQPLFEVGQASMGGPGCPRGSVSVSISPDGAALSLLFDQFALQIEKGAHPMNKASTFCRFRIPVNIPRGYNIETTRVDYRGFVSTQDCCKASLITSGPIVHESRFRYNDNVIRQDFPAMTDVFVVRHDVQQDFRGRCQGQRHIEFTTTLMIRAPQSRGRVYLQDEASLIVDSADMTSSGDGAIELGLRLTPCR